MILLFVPIMEAKNKKKKTLLNTDSKVSRIPNSIYCITVRSIISGLRGSCWLKRGKVLISGQSNPSFYLLHDERKKGLAITYC